MNEGEKFRDLFLSQLSDEESLTFDSLKDRIVGIMLSNGESLEDIRSDTSKMMALAEEIADEAKRILGGDHGA